jgi:KTSC domain
MKMRLDRKSFICLAVGWWFLGNSPSQTAAKDDPLATAVRHEPVESRNIASIGYDAESCVLEIQFHSGGRYRYFAVPPAIFAGMRRAESKGRYFNENIRNRFAYRRLTSAIP